MPNCIFKLIFWKIRKRLSLAATIKELRFLVMAYSFCKRYSMGNYCKMIDSVMHCKECMYCSHSYNGTGILLLAYKFIF
ncbi:hypothetical protein M441DRAFT_154803 [Trichoderma asperellum CBS 433.97]|uniref:Uncharacterized protein n=1 Tax=Trichoderma asperellum (strain ATCC 204424 / CBS 433.97 / NBRC 101777) TaxID=1042311 RepID=A0A2T3YQL8_TRIA4|nr:hypothetical protein M441DRAFT_154803 [Trichoderma asperellum CBS 433.97]PTB34816.1 hypothetical protein M441DRAFT_154803 [Trichoderma asperellum CBS 433.97]